MFYKYEVIAIIIIGPIEYLILIINIRIFVL